jgi:threonyl-tRNA synthetase
VIIHSAVPGGIERYLYLLFDQYEQKGLPLWLQPVQIRLLPVGEAFVDACKELAKKYEKLPLRIEVDDRNVSLSAKLKAAHEDLISHKVVIGQKEIDSGCIELDGLVKELAGQVEDKPFIRREWPMEVSRLP